ncbi:MAG: DUF2478 domain-containing protein [Alphaproteobacteria bacterium]|jgi:nucleoside-triphosphatase THEP1|nr:DUF2478 domain-containing protein [Alphaproteobacteria bacterium]MDP6564694.1 DUF2478 domain-containing protein [Alphaproteobacteria bacterium]MDP6816094.1 DUF2478 domain-containing protein [Alphaproteobacteria bacterium]
MNESATSRQVELAPFAAAVYTPHVRERDALARFAEELRAEGVRVGGLVQEAFRDEQGRTSGIDMVEVDTGRRFPINRPTRENLENHTCSLNTNVLADSTEALRRAVREGADLIVLEKFGEQEQKGQGLIDEIFLAISEEIPLLIAVPEPALELWQERSGDLGDTLAFDLAAFRAWWSGVRSRT